MLQSCFWLCKSTSNRLVIKSIPPETTGVMRIDQETLSITHSDYLLQPTPTFLAKKTTSHILSRLWWLFADFVGGPNFYQVEGGLCPHIDLSDISDGVSRVASQVGSHQILREDELTIAWSTASAVRRMAGNALDRKLGSCHVSQRTEGWTMINKMPLRCPLKKPTSWYASWFLAPPLRAHTPSPQQCNQPPPMPWRHHKLSLPLLRSCQHHVVRHTRCCWRGGSPHVHNKGSAASRCERPIETQFCNI